MGGMITKREIIASVTIIAVMLLIGFLISGKITEHHIDKTDEYNKAVKIQSAELFRYGMDTDVGNAFVYGNMKAEDTVTYPEIGGAYMYIRKVMERYTKHTETVYEYDEDGNVIGQHEEEYWTWDEVGREDKKCETISFLGIPFPSAKFIIPADSYIQTIKESSHIRYKYYGTGAEFTGTIYTSLGGGTIGDNTPFYNNETIDDVVERLNLNIGVLIFWPAWIIIIIVCVAEFYYLDNRWLE